MFTALSALLVAGAGVVRLRESDMERRLLGALLLAAALAALIGIVPALPAAQTALTTLGVSTAHALLVTAAASSGFAFLQQVTRDPTLMRWRPLAIGAGVGLVQVVVLVVVASQPPQVAGVVVPALITAAWPIATTAQGASTLRALGELAPRPLRTGVTRALTGCGGIGVGTALGTASAVDALSNPRKPGCSLRRQALSGPRGCS